MDMELSDQVMALLVTLVALVIAGAVYADIYFNGMASAAPRDSVALVLFAVVRWFIARSVLPPSGDPAPAPVTPGPTP